MEIKILKKLKEKSIKDFYFFFYDKLLEKWNRILYIKSIKKIKINSNQLENYLIGNYSENITKQDDHISKNFLNHIFDILGSGWRENNYSDDIKEYEYMKKKIPKFYFKRNRELCKLIKKSNSNYKYINWHKDFKNDYTFDSKLKVSKIIIYENKQNDIKIPWELSRCYHLPYLARLYRNSQDIRYIMEIRNEILDFIAFNPIGYGVNWKCTMDIAIRVSNWIMAIFICYDIDEYSVFDTEFIKEFKTSVTKHCIYIRYNLENKRNFRGNHYFANIIGLLFSVLMLEDEKLKKDTMEFSIREFIKSIDEQFYSDGGNFEASIPYHRLTLEMVLYGVLVIEYLHTLNKVEIEKVLNKNKEKLEKSILKINKAMIFFMKTLKPDDNLYQLGDNDSGHLFRFFHYGKFIQEADYTKLYLNKINKENKIIWDENELSGKELKILIETLKGKKHNNFFEFLIVNFYNKKKEKIFKFKDFKTEKVKIIKNIKNRGKHYKKTEFIFPQKINLKDLETIFYPEFGLYGYKSKNFYLVIFIGENGQNGRGGHAHNDKTSFELQVYKRDIITDPGSFTYTQDIEKRNLFRSTLAHYVPNFGVEQNVINENCFQLLQRTICNLLVFYRGKIIVECKYGEYHHIRELTIYENKVILEDFTNKLVLDIQKIKLNSKGYGKISK